MLNVANICPGHPKTRGNYTVMAPCNMIYSVAFLLRRIDVLILLSEWIKITEVSSVTESRKMTRRIESMAVDSLV